MSNPRISKNELLKMLREDEEFRYAVAGLIGVEDIKSSLDRLIQSVNRLSQSQEKLTHEVDRLAELHAKLEERVDKLAEKVDRLAELHAKLEERVDKLAIAVENLSREVGRLSETVGFGLEDIARVVVPGYIFRHENISIDGLERRFFVVDGEEVEVNLYGVGVREGRRIVIVGECKSRIYGRDVEEFHKVCEKVRKVVKDELYAFMFGYLIHPSAEDMAKKVGIKVIASYMR
ncbi:MAG: hypothetical protein QXM48_06195 [Sulfolobales archaeon]